jgi:hypothetical protein
MQVLAALRNPAAARWWGDETVARAVKLRLVLPSITVLGSSAVLAPLSFCLTSINLN